jgi:2-keto-3-deoxy-L-rhamnonate aldolase RhmA
LKGRQILNNEHDKLSYIYITNNPNIAKIADTAGVERIMVDLEFTGKEKRQFGKSTWISKHTFEDILEIKKVLTSSELIVRIDSVEFDGLEMVDKVISLGADYIMLPMFKNAIEVKSFLRKVDKRVKTILLIETKEAVENLDEILLLKDIDECFIGLNDLSLSLNFSFLFQVLTRGVVDDVVSKINKTSIKYGFGGIASIGKGVVPSELLLLEHRRLGSSSVILSRSFLKDYDENTNEYSFYFNRELNKIRRSFEESANLSKAVIKKNTKQIEVIVNEYVAKLNF